MASQPQPESIGLDDVMSALMSMGFDFSDCQEAIVNGKLTVQAAVEWILSGKPGNVAAAQPTLKINRSELPGQLGGNRSNPFIAENTSALRGSSSSDAASSNAIMGVDVTENTVVSRSHLSEKQQQIKQSFEEKERQEAKRKVSAEKRQKKLERERILKEIQEDREKVKLVKQLKVEQESPETSQNGQAPPHQQAPGTDQTCPGAGSAKDGTTIIKVRLHSGQVFQHIFPISATLNNVWDEVYKRVQTALSAYAGFIQPFPRREFSREEMKKTLQELGLVPSGSLVLKKKVVDQAGSEFEVNQPAAIMRALDEAEQARPQHNSDMSDEESPPLEHDWGRGFRVEDGADNPADGAVDQDNNMGMDIDDEHENNNFDQIPGLDQHGIVGNQAAVFNAADNYHIFQGFGQRLVPEGVPGDNDRHIRQGAAIMAAEAAAHRFANPQHAPDPQTKAYQAEFPFHSVRSLQDLAMCALARRLTDPRKQIYSMSGLSEDLLQKFLAYLMKERLLRPKILPMIPSYLNRLVLDYYPYTTNELLHSARIFVHLQSLSLVSCSIVTDAGLSSISGMKNLKVLNLNGCSQITNACFAVISELPNLQILSLEGTSVTDPSVIQFANANKCPCLQHLDLSRTSITQKIFVHLQKFPVLRTLYVKQTKVSSLFGLDQVQTLENLDISETCVLTDTITSLTHLPRLRQLSLTGTQDVHGDRALYYLKEMKLTAILLPSRSTTTDVGMAYISGFLLTMLDLTNYTNVGNAGMVHIGKIASLKKLLLSNTKVSDEGMQHLSGLTNLEVLFVDRTYISNVGAAVITNFKNLNELSLSETSVTSNFLKQGVLNSCQGLTKLNMSKTIISDKGIAYLKMPNLQFLNLDCTHVHQNSQSLIETNCPQLKKVTIVTLSSVMEVEED